MYQLIMTLITIAVFAALLIAGLAYVNPQAITQSERAERILAERNRINLALQGYFIANRSPAPDPGWEGAILPHLDGALIEIGPDLSWTLEPGPEGGGGLPYRFRRGPALAPS